MAIKRTRRAVHSADGFTLVELAIVMVIIGLLIGGILKGQEVVRNARIKATIADFKAIMASHHTFADAYGDIPGDMPNAATRIPGCTAANFCVNGDGNGLLGDRVGGGQDVAATPGIQENIQYWKHLALAGFIASVNPAASNLPGDSAYGQSHPDAPVGGGWNAIMTTPPAGVLPNGGNMDFGGPGIILELTGAPNTHAIFLSPVLAAQMDRKLDDGRPNSGSVTAEYATSSNCDEDTTNSYQETADQAECVQFFQID